MSLQSTPQLHGSHHLQRGALCRYRHGLFWARPRYLPQLGWSPTTAYSTVQLQMAQWYDNIYYYTVYNYNYTDQQTTEIYIYIYFLLGIC